MKLATLKDASRDGTLAVVSRDLRRAVSARAIAPTMQAALDDWATAAPALVALFDDLEAGRATAAVPFAASDAAAPLPRAYQWIDGSVYLSHYRRIQQSMGLGENEPPPSRPMMYQGTGDDFQAPTGDIALPDDESHEIDFELELAVITDDVPMGTTAAAAAGHIKLVALLNDVSLRGLIAAELATGFGPINAKPATSFAPVFVTPDEIGPAWSVTGIDLPVRAEVNGEVVGHPNAGGMLFGFDRIIEYAARTRRLGAGTVVGSGTVSSPEPNVGYCCIAERRAVEVVETGTPQTPFLRFGDRVCLEIERDGRSLFGTIDQTVVRAAVPVPVPA